MFSPVLAPSILPPLRQLYYAGQVVRRGGRDNGRHKLKFRLIHAKTGELRTELRDLRPRRRACRAEDDADFMANLSTAIVFIARAGRTILVAFSCVLMRVNISQLTLT